MNKEQFREKYNFVIRVIKSCITIEQYQSARKLAWLLIDRDWSVFDDYVWSHLRVIAIELDSKKLWIEENCEFV